MLDQFTPRDRIVAAALKLAAERPWSDVTLLIIAQEAGLTLVELRREFATKGEILIAFARSIDDQVLREAAARGGARPLQGCLAGNCSEFRHRACLALQPVRLPALDAAGRGLCHRWLGRRLARRGLGVDLCHGFPDLARRR